ncbi:MAG TPA: branched-chain amino acid ABC transporter ATP-binding protein/permease [Burkholderiaceae bacterium]|nr:branched-chain amino acid ABC transporter ATP-binding protein/permease [Burkholderiaceae bacterium]
MRRPRHLRYLIAFGAIAAFPFVAPNAYYVNLGQDIAIVAIAALGLNILFGLSGQLSLGQAGFMALGAYGSAVLAVKAGWPLWATVFVALGVSALAGMVIGLVALRTRTHYLAMVTLAFGYIVEIFAQRWVDLTGGSMGLVGVPQLNLGNFVHGPTIFFLVIGFTFLVLQMLNDYAMPARWGRNLQAIKESESFAVTVGIDAPRWRSLVFVVGAVLAGLSGYFFAHQAGYISSDAFGLDRSIALLIAVVIGGLGRAYGPIVGATILVLLNQITADLYEVSYFIFGGILLLVMLFFPAGAVGAMERLLGRDRRSAPLPSAPADAARASPGDALPPMVGSRHAGTGPILELRGITKSYAGVTALSELSLDILPGTVHAVIGPNGAGKSTLVNILSGLYAPNAGTISFCGQDITRLAPHRRAERGITRTFQNLQLIGTLTVAENVMLGLRGRGGFVAGWLGWLASDAEARAERDEALRLLRFFGIERFADAMPGELAYGHRKLCELARALAQRPTMLLLDEPIAGLNEEEAREVMARIRTLKALGVTILLIEHNMTFVMELSDTVSVLDYGRKIAEGTPAEVQANQGVITAYLGAEEAA